MNTHFTYNFVEKTIVGSKRSIDRANKGLSPEYAELTKMMAEHPDFAVTVKIIKANNNKKTYSNLTIKRMEKYIELQENAEEKLKEFKALQDLGKAMGALYPICKKWFLKEYEEFKNADEDSEEDSTNSRDVILATKTISLASRKTS